MRVRSVKRASEDFGCFDLACSGITRESRGPSAPDYLGLVRMGAYWAIEGENDAGGRAAQEVTGGQGDRYGL